MGVRVCDMEDGDRRCYARLHKTIEMRFGRFEDLSKFTADKSATVLDIGGGGLRFLSNESIDEGAQLMMVLEFPGWREWENEWAQSENLGDIGVLKVVGTTVRCSPSNLELGMYEVAVCFCGRVRR